MMLPPSTFHSIEALNAWLAQRFDMIKAAGLGIAYHAKPVVAAEAGAAIRHTDLTAALFFQGFTAAEFVHA